MLVLLDRDGVINEDLPTGVRTLEEFYLLDGALEAMAMLTKAGHTLAIVSNQSAVAKGWTTQEIVDDIHTKLIKDVETTGGNILHIYLCTDHPDAPTHRRKPNPGMIEEALVDFGATASDTIFIGDALRDLQAAHAAGCQKILVKTGKGARLLQEGIPEALQPVDVFANLLAASKHLCEK